MKVACIMSHNKTEYNFIQRTFLFKSTYKVFFFNPIDVLYFLLHPTVLCTWYVLIHIEGNTYAEQAFRGNPHLNVRNDWCDSNN